MVIEPVRRIEDDTPEYLEDQFGNGKENDECKENDKDIIDPFFKPDEIIEHVLPAPPGLLLLEGLSFSKIPGRPGLSQSLFIFPAKKPPDGSIAHQKTKKEPLDICRGREKRTSYMQVWSALLGGVFIAAFIVGIAASSPQPGDQPGYLRIESRPPGAMVIYDGMLIGMTPITYPVYPSDSGSHTIVVSATGYHSYTTSYVPKVSAGKTDYISAELTPTGSLGTLVVKSRPTGALVMVDMGKGQQAPWTYQDIRAGGHLVQAYLSGYQPFATIVDIPDGGTITVDALLQPLSETGIIQARSSPGGADVYVDGIYRGSTATTIGNVAAGTHFILLKAVGYQDWTGLVEVRTNQITPLDITLTRYTAPESGFIYVNSDPAGASVYLDGVFQGITQAGNPLDMTGILPGEHTLTLTLDNHEEYITRVMVKAGETTQVNAVLTPSQSIAASGILQVISDPGGANVFIDDTCRGITPLTLSSVPAGSHTLRLTLPGYRDHTLTYNQTPGGTSHIEVVLTPELPKVALPGLLPLIALLSLGFYATWRKGY